MLDKLPAPLRHLIIVAGSVFLGAIAKDIVTAGGIAGLSLTNLRVALDSAVVSAVTAAGALYLTPLTKQYGIGKK